MKNYNDGQIQHVDKRKHLRVVFCISSAKKGFLFILILISKTTKFKLNIFMKNRKKIKLLSNPLKIIVQVIGNKRKQKKYFNQVF